MGAPVIMIEKLPAGYEVGHAIDIMETQMGRPGKAVSPVEIGGLNAVEPLVATALIGRVVVDCDCIGRAFPELQMTTASIYGCPAGPCVMVDDKYNTVVIRRVQSSKMLENLMRASVIQFGCWAGICMAPMLGSDVNQGHMIKYSVSYSWKLGRAILQAREQKQDPVQAVIGFSSGKLIFVGKIVNVERNTIGGFSRAVVTIEGLPTQSRDSPSFASQVLKVDVQNENIIASLFDATDEKAPAKIAAATPDIISLVDTATCAAITTEVLRYGLRVSVIALPCQPLMRTPEALEFVGPRAFGYDIDYTPIN